MFVCFVPCLALFDIVAWGGGGGGGREVGGGAVTNVVRTCCPTPLYLKAIKYV